MHLVAAIVCHTLLRGNRPSCPCCASHILANVVGEVTLRTDRQILRYKKKIHTLFSSSCFYYYSCVCPAVSERAPRVPSPEEEMAAEDKGADAMALDEKATPPEAGAVRFEIKKWNAVCM